MSPMFSTFSGTRLIAGPTESANRVARSARSSKIDQPERLAKKGAFNAHLRVAHAGRAANHFAQYCEVKNIKIDRAIKAAAPTIRCPGPGLAFLPKSRAVLAVRTQTSTKVSRNNPARRTPDFTCSPTVRLSRICIRRRSRRHSRTNFRFYRYGSGKETLRGYSATCGNCPAYAKSRQRNVAFPRRASSRKDAVLQPLRQRLED